LHLTVQRERISRVSQDRRAESRLSRRRGSTREHHRGRGASSDPNLVVNVLQVFLNRSGADGQNRGNFRIRLPARHPTKDLVLSKGQPAQRPDLARIARLLGEQRVILPNLTAWAAACGMILV